MSKRKFTDAEIHATLERQRAKRARHNTAAIHGMAGAPVRPRELSPTERAIYLLIGK